MSTTVTVYITGSEKETKTATQTIAGPEPRTEETYGKMAGMAMMFFALFGCLLGAGLGAAIVFWLKP